MEVKKLFLPDELMLNIFKRLPVKSLIRFQCVCKHWRNLIIAPSFIEEHLHHSSHQNSSLILKLCHTPPFRWMLLNSDMQQVVVQSSPLIDSLPSFRVYGSSNGLLCMYSHSINSILLWNPATRETRHVPTMLIINGPHHIGFGFSPIVNDYKIVIIHQGMKDEETSQVNRVEVFSLVSKSWREVGFEGLEDLNVGFETFSTNGKIFWLGWQEDEYGNDDYCTVVSFDIANEVFTLLPMPEVDFESRIFPSLTLYKDDLAMLFAGNESEDGMSVELWVMKEVSDTLGDEEWIWTKKYTSRPVQTFSLIDPMIIWRDQIICDPEIDLQDDSDERKFSLYLFDPATDEMTTLPIHKYGEGLQALDYVESLVPIGEIPVENP